MLQISNTVFITDREIEISAIRSQGAGGQNVNKVASAIHLRFDIGASSLPDRYKDRLLQLNDNRITSEGVIVIKAQEHRSQEQNREEALRRLQELIKSAIVIPKRRKPSKATRSSQRKRLDSKTKRGEIKAMRGKVTDWAIIQRKPLLWGTPTYRSILVGTLQKPISVNNRLKALRNLVFTWV